MKTKLASLVFVSVLLTCSCSGIIAVTHAELVSGATGGSAQAAQFAPINPAFVSYQQNLSAGKVSSGFIPPPIDLTQLKGQSIRNTLVGSASLPSSYDLRPNNVTPVKDQGSCGACWAFATYASLESYLKKNVDETWDFSENNLKNTNGFDTGPCGGGNDFMSTAYLARWSGPVNATADPYNPSNGSSPANLPVQKHVQDVYIIPDRANSTDNDNIKTAVMTYGAIYTEMYWTSGSSSLYNSATSAYYDPSATAVNHGVAIVGWNDNYPASNFSSKPSGNGAWIVKNSFGTSYGDNGYFYVSYYDANIGQYNAAFTAQPTTNYTNIYQYDPLGATSSFGQGTPSEWGANVFTANSSGNLAAVSFYTFSLNAPYQVYVYTNPTSGPINASGAVENVTGVLPLPGYHTIPLNSSIPLQPEEKFSVVVKFTSTSSLSSDLENYYYPVPIEAPIPGYSSAATAQAGQSYYHTDDSSWSQGSTWTDMTSSSANTNICIKAFTTAHPTQLTLTASNTTPIVNQQVTFNATLTNGTTPLSGKTVTIYHYLNNVRYNDATNTTNASGQVTVTTSFGSPGTRTYYATFAGDSSYQNSTSRVLTITVSVGQTQMTLTASNTTPIVNQQVTFNATLTNGTTPLSGKTVTIYHYLNNVRYNDATNTTNATGQVTVTTSFASPGTRTYYATFAGDSSYQNSTSRVLTITVSVGQTQMTLTASNTTPIVNQQVTFNATLTNGTTPLSGKTVTIYHYLNNVRYNDATNTTNATGQVTVTTSFASPGTRTYYATFAGDSSYQNSTSRVLTITVSVGQTQMTLTASNTTPIVNQQVTFNATLTNGTTPLSGKTVTIYHYLNNVRYNDATNTTNATGQVTVTTSFASPGTRTYYATFAGDSSYQNSTSRVLTITVQ